MTRKSSLRPTIYFTIMIAVAASIVAIGGNHAPGQSTVFHDLKPTGQPQLVSVEPLPAALPASDGEMCEWTPASSQQSLVAALQQNASSARPTPLAPAGSKSGNVIDRPP